MISGVFFAVINCFSSDFKQQIALTAIGAQSKPKLTSLSIDTKEGD